MRVWLAVAEPGEPELLLAETAIAYRPRVALLMRDLLSRYPSTIVGVPTLLFATPEVEDTGGPTPSALTLPFPAPDVGQPCEDLHFLGWLSADTQLPVALPFRPERYLTEVPWFQATSMVAVFRSHPEVFDLDTIELPNFWWSEVFRSVAANIHLTARLLLPYPDALEAARVLQAYTRGQPVPDKGLFLSDTAWTLARDEAALFQESCRHLFKNVAG